MAKDPNQNVRFGVAQNEECPASILEALSHDDAIFSENSEYTIEYWIKRAVGYNPAASIETLTGLSNSDDIWTRIAVLSNKNITDELFVKIVEATYWDILNENIYYAYIDDTGIYYSDEYTLHDETEFIEYVLEYFGEVFSPAMYKMFTEDFREATERIFAGERHSLLGGAYKITPTWDIQ